MKLTCLRRSETQSQKALTTVSRSYSRRSFVTRLRRCAKHHTEWKLLNGFCRSVQCCSISRFNKQSSNLNFQSYLMPRQMRHAPTFQTHSCARSACCIPNVQRHPRRVVISVKEQGNLNEAVFKRKACKTRKQVLVPDQCGIDRDRKK